MLRIIPAAILLVAGTLQASPIIREAGAIYLSDFDAPPLKLKVLTPGPATFDLNGTRYVGTLRFPQTVEVQAIADHAYRVRGNAQQGQILGWIDPKYLEPLSPETLADLKASDERRRTVDALIAKNQVALGMTPEEVERSIGRPSKRTNRATAEATEQIWDYVEYASIPQNSFVTGPDGLQSIVTTYVKTPIGRLTITFKDGIADSLDQTEGSILTGNQTTVVAPPIVMFW